MLKLDYSNHQCPYPVVETRKQMLASPGQLLEVLVADRAGRDNVSRLATKMGYQISVTAAATGFRLTLSPAGLTLPELPQPAMVASGKTVIYCNSDQMGSGDEEFGRLLLRNFVMTLLEMDPLPDIILFVNSGINLTTAGSEVLEALKKLDASGVELASCGLCLDFYQKKDQLRVGRTTNMLEIAEVQCQAVRVICP